MNPDAPSPLPPRPTEFVWQATAYRVTALLAEGHDYRRRGRQARHLRPEHLARAAATSGSAPSGRPAPARFFELYFDRAPPDAGRRQGGWFLVSALADDEPSPPARAS